MAQPCADCLSARLPGTPDLSRAGAAPPSVRTSRSPAAGVPNRTPDCRTTSTRYARSAVLSGTPMIVVLMIVLGIGFDGLCG
jgi:hypothetical protein